jgi:hypothetical protein
MTVEDRLRDALAARAASVEPSTDAWTEIEARLGRARRRAVVRRVTALVVVAAAAAVVTGVMIVSRDSGSSVQIVPATEAPPLPNASMVVPPTTVAPTTTPPDEAALDFARTVLGMAAASVDNVERSGPAATVAVRAFPDGPVTDVSVIATRGGWAVESAITEAVTVTSPLAGGAVSSPLTVAGVSTSFEGQISVQVYAAGSATPLTASTATGGANGTTGPFSAQLSFTSPGGTGFVVVGVADASGHGRLSGATVVPVLLG